MGAGKILSIIAAVLALAVIALSFALPNIFGLYRIEFTALGITFGAYITGIGTFMSTGGLPPLGQLAIFELIGGILVIVGAVVLIVGAVKEMKAAGIVGGILVLLGPILLIIDMLIGLSDFATLIALLGGPAGATPLWGSFTITGPPDILMAWGIWIGTFITAGAGVLGIIGGATL
ncbi:MAG: hypothetical protein ACFFEO_13475 [Candidatus Thorarchaeota archaeon]